MPVNAQRIVQFPSTRTTYNSGIRKRPTAQRRPWLRVVIALVTVFYLVGAGGQLVKQEVRMRQLRQSYNQLVATQEGLQTANDSLRRQIDSLAKDPAYLEQLAREMGMVKPNDTIYLPVNPIR